MTQPEPERTYTPAQLAAWGIALFAACRAVEIVLEAQSLATLVGQAVLVEWGVARLGVSWSAPAMKVTSSMLVRRAATGAGIGIVCGLVVFGTLLFSRQLTFTSVTQIESSVLAIGLISAALGAWRDELLFHGVTVRVLEGRSPVVRVLGCGVASAGAALGRHDASPRSVFVAMLLGIIAGALWIRDRGAWQPFAQSTMVRWVTGTLLAGGIVHSRLVDNSWAGGSGGMLSGTAAAIALAPLAVIAVLYTRSFTENLQEQSRPAIG